MLEVVEPLVQRESLAMRSVANVGTVYLNVVVVLVLMFVQDVCRDTIYGTKNV